MVRKAVGKTLQARDSKPGWGRINPVCYGVEKGADKPGSPSKRSGHDTAGSGSHRGLLCRGVTGRKWCFGHMAHILGCQTCIQRND